jgi:hypothetical protein
VRAESDLPIPPDGMEGKGWRCVYVSGGWGAAGKGEGTQCAAAGATTNAVASRLLAPPTGGRLQPRARAAGRPTRIAARRRRQASAPARDLVARLLTLRPAERIAAEAALQHGWFAAADARRPLDAVRENLRSLRASTRLKRAMRAATVRARRDLLPRPARALRRAAAHATTPPRAPHTHGLGPCPHYHPRHRRHRAHFSLAAAREVRARRPLRPGSRCAVLPRSVCARALPRARTARSPRRGGCAGRMQAAVRDSRPAAGH